jgi:nitrogen PTS system EIIA component
MRITDFVVPERVSIRSEVTSKKRSFEVLSELLGAAVQAEEELPARRISEALNAREKLGSTGLGHGVAIPHGRLTDLAAPRIAVLRLENGIDFDALDREPVDILIGLVVPDAATQEHVEILGQLARGLSRPDTIGALRRAKDPAALLQVTLAAFRDA